MPGAFVAELCQKLILIILDRAGMHLLFYGKKQIQLLEGGKLDGILKSKSVKVLVLYPLCQPG